MKKKMRKWLCLMSVIYLSLQMQGLNAYGGEIPVPDKATLADSRLEDMTQDPSVLDDWRGYLTVRQRLLEAWSEYLAVMDEMYDTQEWAYGYIEEFLESEDWESLEEARLACEAASESLAGLEERAASIQDLSEEDYAILYDRGIDIGYQTDTLLSCRALVKDAATLLDRSYQPELESSFVFSQKERDILAEMLKVSINQNQKLAACDCTATNYLLVSFDDQELSEQYWKQMADQYPVLTQNRDEWSDDVVELLAKTQTLTDEMEESMISLYQVMSMRRADFDKSKEAQGEKDGFLLAASYEAFRDSPSFILTPDWYDPFQAEFFYTFENGTLPQPGEVLDAGGMSAGFRMKGIEKEQVESYLEKAGSYADRIEEGPEDGSWTVYAGDYQVVFTAGPSEVTVQFMGEDIAFAPAGIIQR